MFLWVVVGSRGVQKERSSEVFLVALVWIGEREHSSLKAVWVTQEGDGRVLTPGHVVGLDGAVLVQSAPVEVRPVPRWVLLNAPVGGGAGKDGGFFGNEADEFTDHRVRGEVVVSSTPELREGCPVFAREG